MKKNLAKKVTLGIVIGTMLMGSSAAYAEGEFIMETFVPHGSIPAGITALAAGDSLAGADNSIVISVGDGTGVSDEDNPNNSYAFAEATNSVVIGAGSSAGAPLGGAYNPTGSNSVVIGADSHVNSYNNVAVGAGIDAMTGSNNVILGYGSSTGGGVSNVVSVGSGVAPASTSDPTLAPQYRQIINVQDGINDHDAATVGQVKGITLTDNNDGTYTFTDVSGDTVNFSAGGNVDLTGYYTKTDADSKFLTQEAAKETYVQIKSNDAGDSNQPNISIDSEGQMVFGTTSSWIGGNGEGFFAGTIDPNQGHTADNAKASMTEDGAIKGAGGNFTVDASGNVTATNLYTKADVYNKTEADSLLAAKANAADVYTKTEVNTALDAKANAADVYTKTEVNTALDAKANAADVYKKAEVYNKTETDSKLDGKADKAMTLAGYGITDAYTMNDIDSMIGGNSAAISGLDQRVASLDSRLDEVGAGAAALAALHPLDYDPENKLSFAAGVGRYQGATASAIGAFYRPNEDMMLSLGGTAGNGENMVNLGVSFAIGKGSSGIAKLSKVELVNKVQQMEAENAAMKAENKEVRHEINNVKAENQNLREELAEMKVMLQELAAKI